MARFCRAYTTNASRSAQRAYPTCSGAQRTLPIAQKARSFERAWSNLKEQTPGQLVNNTHWVSGAWNKRYVPGAKGRLNKSRGHDCGVPSPHRRRPDEAAGQVYRSPPNNEKLGDNVAKLESDLAMEREQRAEERFIWITTVAVLGDFIAYGMLRDFFGFALIFLLELIVLAIVARRLGVDWAVQLIGWAHVPRLTSCCSGAAIRRRQARTASAALQACSQKNPATLIGGGGSFPYPHLWG